MGGRRGRGRGQAERSGDIGTRSGRNPRPEMRVSHGDERSEVAA